MSNINLILGVACAILSIGGDIVFPLGKGKATMPDYPGLEQGWRGTASVQQPRFAAQRVSPIPLGLPSFLLACSRRGADGIC